VSTALADAACFGFRSGGDDVFHGLA
jgi:hypothetical protein